MPHSTNFSRSRVYVYNDEDDRALVRRCLDGHTDAFGSIVERYHRPFFTIAARILGSRDEASDAVQNAFIKAYEKLETFDGTRRFFSWAYRILVNECLNARRDRHPSEPISADLAADHGPLEIVERAERQRQVQAAVLDLPLEYREVIVLRYFVELPYDEISEAVGIPEKTVKSRLYSARQRLAAALAERGIDRMGV